MIENGKAISILYVFYEGDKVVGSQFGVEFAPQLQDFIDRNSAQTIALVNTDEYLITVSESAQEILQIYTGAPKNKARHLAPPVDISILTLKEITPLSEIEAPSIPTTFSDDGPGGFGLPVSAITWFEGAKPLNTCFATSAISICQ